MEVKGAGPGKFHRTRRSRPVTHNEAGGGGVSVFTSYSASAAAAAAWTSSDGVLWLEPGCYIHISITCWIFYQDCG